MAERRLPDLLGRTSTYAALVAIVGAVNLGCSMAARNRRGGPVSSS